MRGDGLSRRLWAAQTSQAALRRRRVAQRLRRDQDEGEGATAAEGRADDAGDAVGGAGGHSGAGGGIAVTDTLGTDEYWDEARRVNRADDVAARRSIAVPGDGSGSFSYAQSEKTPIATPESWGKADDGTGFSLR